MNAIQVSTRDQCQILTHNTFFFAESETVIDPNGTFKMITRGEWLARPPSAPPTCLELPAKKVIIAHTATRYFSTPVSMLT